LKYAVAATANGHKLNFETRMDAILLRRSETQMNHCQPCCPLDVGLTTSMRGSRFWNTEASMLKLQQVLLLPLVHLLEPLQLPLQLQLQPLLKLHLQGPRR